MTKPEPKMTGITESPVFKRWEKVMNDPNATREEKMAAYNRYLNEDDDWI